MQLSDFQQVDCVAFGSVDIFVIAWPYVHLTQYSGYVHEQIYYQAVYIQA